MAERRMFAKTIIDSDSFLDMSLSTQSLYFHLSMRADDEGFINNPKKIARMIGTNDDEIKVLLAKKFIIGFESGIVVIKHWMVHNYIQKDRCKETIFSEEKALLGKKANNVYTMDTKCVHNVQIGKDRLGKDRLGKVSIDYIVGHLNEKASTRYKYSSIKTISLINSREKEGFIQKDFISVIDKKCTEWLETDMEKFLRPETLFGTKFEGYLNSKINTKKPDSLEARNEEFLNKHFSNNIDVIDTEIA